MPGRRVWLLGLSTECWRLKFWLERPSSKVSAPNTIYESDW